MPRNTIWVFRGPQSGIWTSGFVIRIMPPPRGAERVRTSRFDPFRLSLDAALHYADIRAAFETAGTPIGQLDLLIAAQARSLGATLVTANAGEFKRVKGLKVLAWK